MGRLRVGRVKVNAAAWFAIACFAIVIVFYALGACYAPAKALALSSALQRTFSVDVGAFLKVAPFAGGTFALYAAVKKTGKDVLWVLFALAAAGCLMIVSADKLLSPQAPTVEVVKNPLSSNQGVVDGSWYSSVGFWRFMLAFSICVAFWDAVFEKPDSRFSEEDWASTSLGKWALSLGTVFFLMLLFEVFPAGQEGGDWGRTVSRYIYLSGDYAYKSFVVFVNAFLEAIKAESLFWAAAPCTFFGATFSVSAAIDAAGAKLRELRGLGKRGAPSVNPPLGHTGVVHGPPRPRLVKEAGREFAYVLVYGNGGKSAYMKLMVDTGADHVTINEKTLKAMNVKPEGEANIRLWSGKVERRKVGRITVAYGDRWSELPVFFGKKGDLEVLGFDAIERLGIYPLLGGTAERAEGVQLAPAEEKLRGAPKAPSRAAEAPQVRMERPKMIHVPTEEFATFTADSGRDARIEANKRGFVALFVTGKPKWNLEGGKLEFMSVSEGLAERLLGGRITKEEKRGLARWIEGGALKVEADGEGFRTVSVGEKLRRDVERQLSWIKRVKEWRERGAVPFEQLLAESCEEGRKRIGEAGFVAVYMGVDAFTGKHAFYPLLRGVARKLLQGEAVYADAWSREALEEMTVKGYLERRGDGFYVLKSEDLRADLKNQLKTFSTLKHSPNYVV